MTIEVGKSGGGFTVQSGTASLGVGSLNVTIAEVDLTKSFVEITYYSTSSSSEVNKARVNAELTTSTNLQLTRASVSNTATIKWQVITSK